MLLSPGLRLAKFFDARGIQFHFVLHNLSWWLKDQEHAFVCRAAYDIARQYAASRPPAERQLAGCHLTIDQDGYRSVDGTWPALRQLHWPRGRSPLGADARHS